METLAKLCRDDAVRQLWQPVTETIRRKKFKRSRRMKK
jgi:hypothetical protein